MSDLLASVLATLYTKKESLAGLTLDDDEDRFSIHNCVPFSPVLAPLDPATAKLNTGMLARSLKYSPSFADHVGCENIASMLYSTQIRTLSSHSGPSSIRVLRRSASGSFIDADPALRKTQDMAETHIRTPAPARKDQHARTLLLPPLWLIYTSIVELHIRAPSDKGRGPYTIGAYTSRSDSNEGCFPPIRAREASVV
ncbi:hypothetical protein B0H19DRAFT_1263682 [Mycena capillaripes]|nr:hypothetical protein B0H19DRAFT_1263682 [Mycena capillaripes]